MSGWISLNAVVVFGDRCQSVSVVSGWVILNVVVLVCDHEALIISLVNLL